MQENSDSRRLEAVEAAFTQRYVMKKRANLTISMWIAVLGITSFLYGLRLEPMPTIFRWLTVDGTLFTTLSAILCIGVNLLEVLRNTELTWRSVYYLRLSSAVAESVILIVVLFSQLPVFPEHLPLLDRYDSFVMHVLVPLLGIESFLINDSPIGRLKPGQRWQGTLFVSCYGVTILTLISTGLLPPELIPYPFLNYREKGWGVFLAAFVFVYGCGYLMAWGISEGNRKLSWLWFKGIAHGQGSDAGDTNSNKDVHL